MIFQILIISGKVLVLCEKRISELLLNLYALPAK